MRALNSAMSAWVYIVTNQPRGARYIGVTNDLVRRIWEHPEGAVKGFTARHDCKMLVWYEPHDTMLAAIQREKNVKRWVRQWKVELVERMNPKWEDLWPVITR